MDLEETQPRCVGCENPAEFPLDQDEKKYCRSCIVRRMEQMTAQERQFRFWRLIRNAESELWAIGHPEAKGAKEKDNDRVGEVWVAFDAALKALHVHAYLEPALKWKQAVPIMLPIGIVIDDSYLDVLGRVLGRFFEVGFNVENRFYEFAFLTGERKTSWQTTNRLDESGEA